MVTCDGSFLGYKNCAELLDNGFNKSGVYPVESEMGNVYCDQTSDGGGTLIYYLNNRVLLSQALCVIGCPRKFDEV